MECLAVVAYCLGPELSLSLPYTDSITQLETSFHTGKNTYNLYSVGILY